jgi:hypothetical protein
MLIRLTHNNTKEPFWLNKKRIILVWWDEEYGTGVKIEGAETRYIRETPEQIARLCEPLYQVGADA